MTQPPSTRRDLPSVEVKERSRKDPGFLDLDPTTLKPDRHYRWVRCRADEHMTQISKMKLIGYTVELKTGGVKTLADTDNRPDGAIAIGDLVLMSCPQSLHEQRQREQFLKSENLLASTTAQTEQMAKDKGISIIKDADHN